MNEKPGLKSFSDLGKLATDMKKAEQKVVFERVLKDKFEKVPAGNFTTELSQIDSISIIPVHSKDGRFSINAIIYYKNEQKKENHITWSISGDGTIFGQVPPNLKVDREELAMEILKTIERINIDFWKKTDLDILPNSDEGESTGIEGVSKKDDFTRSRTDPERLRFLEGQPMALFGFVNKKNGFKGFRGAVFPTFIVLENDQVGNAAYIVDFPEPIELEDDPRGGPPF